jgi:hypothetical protein
MVLVVEIEDRAPSKPFLGGWRNVVDNIEYHDATSQTSPTHSNLSRRKFVSVSVQATGPLRFSRSISSIGIERAIQASSSDCFPKLGESFIDARDTMELQRREEAAIRIQRFYR